MRWSTIVAPCALLAIFSFACSSNDRGDPQLLQPTLAGDLDSELAERAARYSEVEFQASYIFAVTTAEGAIEGMFTWYQRSGQARGDFVGTVGDFDFDLIVIPGPGYPSEEFLYVCWPAEQRCMEHRAESEENAYPDGIFYIVLAAVALDSEEFAEATKIDSASNLEILGTDVVCFQGVGRVPTIDIPPNNISGKVCVTVDGITLSITQEQQNYDTTLEAISFSRLVDADVFELPFPLKDES